LCPCQRAEKSRETKKEKTFHHKLFYNETSFKREYCIEGKLKGMEGKLKGKEGTLAK
jgi:hypothetical protein